MIKSSTPQNPIKTFSNKGTTRLLRCLTVLMKMLGGFPYAEVKESKNVEKGRADRFPLVGCGLGPYEMKPLAFSWSVVIVLINVGGVVLMFIEKPDSTVIFGTSKLFGFLQTLTMKVEAAVTFLMLILLISLSPRLSHLINLLHHVCKDTNCLWTPSKDSTFLMLVSIVVVSHSSTIVAMLLVYPHMNEVLNLNPYLSVVSCIMLSCKIITRHVIVILLYSMGHILASLYSLCVSGFILPLKVTANTCDYITREEPITNIILEPRYEKDNREHAIPVTDEPMNGDHKRGKYCGKAKWKDGSEEDAKISCEKLFRLHECQQALNNYFSWLVTLLATHCTFVIAEQVFFLSTGQAPVPYMRMVCGLLVLDNLIILSFIIFSPGDILDQVRCQ